MQCLIRTSSPFAVENVKEVLKLSVEQKGVQVPTGDLTVFLDGLTVSDQEELEQAPSSAATNGASEPSICVQSIFSFIHLNCHSHTGRLCLSF